MGLAEVSTILWRERDLLDLLAFKLDEQSLLLAAGRTRWLTQAADELDAVMDELRHVELVRAIETDALATELGLPAGASLADLAGAVEEPWAELLWSHRAALIELSEDVRTRSATNCDALERGAGAVRDLIGAAATGVGALDRQPRDRRAAAGILLDQRL
jgi:hypothetical protein